MALSDGGERVRTRRYRVDVPDLGLRELRRQAHELVRRVEAGESITVTVSGRPAARLVLVRRDAWRTFDEVQELFAGPADRDWARDRELLDTDPRHPWDSA